MVAPEARKVKLQRIVPGRMNVTRGKDMRCDLGTAIQVMAFILTVSFSALSACAENGLSPAELMDRIGGLMEGKTPDGHAIGKEDAWSQVLALREELGNCGEQAVPEIEARIKAEKDPRTRSVFLYALGKIPGERVDKILLGYFCFDRGMESTVGAQITWRTEHNGPFTFVVPDEQIEAMLKIVRERPVFEAVHALRILGMCANNPPEMIMPPIIERFMKEVTETSISSAVTVGGSCVSARVYLLNSFILAFSYMPATALPCLREARTKARGENREDLVKWFSMALGICGDASMADYLKEIALHDPDRYVRLEAIRPYAFSAGKQSLPVLLRLLEDKTQTEYPMSFVESTYIIRNEARSVLIETIERITGKPIPVNPDLAKIATEILSQP